jgi:hypothetical protein
MHWTMHTIIPLVFLLDNLINQSTKPIFQSDRAPLWHPPGAPDPCFLVHFHIKPPHGSAQIPDLLTGL